LTSEYFFGWRLFISGTEAPGWELRGVKALKSVDDLPPITASSWAPKKNPDELLRIKTYECSSLNSAHSFLLTVLGECDVAYMKREAAREQQAFGDVAFTNLEGTSILFARGNVVVSARNAGVARANLGEFLHQFDLGLKSHPGRDKETEAMERFRFADGKFYVGDQVPLEFTPAEAPLRTQYKFFAESGEVLLQDGRLLYEPEKPGEQTLNIFGINAEREVRKQKVSITIGER
jgi:hypothetical protein